MSVSFFGILTTLYLMLVPVNGLLIQKRSLEQVYVKLFLTSIIFSLVFDVGYIAEVSGFVVEYNYLFSVFNFIFAVLVLSKHKMSYKFLAYFVCFILVITSVTVVSYIVGRGYVSCPNDMVWDSFFNTNKKLPTVYIGGNAFFVICRIIIFLISFYAFAKAFSCNNMLAVIESIYKVSLFVIFASMVEIIISNLIDPYLVRKLAYEIFGHSSSTYDVSKSLYGFYPPMLFMREPSSYAYALFFFGLNNIAYYSLKKSKKVKLLKLSIFAILAFLIISFSMSALIYLAVLTLLALYLMGGKKSFVVVISVLIVFAVFVGSLYSERIENIMSYITLFNTKQPGKLPDKSEVIRLYSIYNNLNVFMQNPLFGGGVSSVYSFSALVTLFANIGIVGVVLYFSTIKVITDEFFKTNKFSWLTLIIIIVTFAFTGHMSNILYIERISYLFILVKMLQLYKAKKAKAPNKQRNLQAVAVKDSSV